eukprot:TRINITY_DN99157_c0_g1_i1.p3 TRINITY_DN99157_c0_g1~~TRINITY_DN99157_c0_g1_i1.p3  ORF type:complete len:103 (+),score=12.20 TRINITY_DN99157_c0_g1_i1:258-566(+)
MHLVVHAGIVLKSNTTQCANHPLCCKPTGYRWETLHHKDYPFNSTDFGATTTTSCPSHCFSLHWVDVAQDSLTASWEGPNLGSRRRPEGPKIDKCLTGHVRC